MKEKKLLWCELPQEYNSDDFVKAPDTEGSIPPGSKYVIQALENRGWTVEVRRWEEIGPVPDHALVMVPIMFVRQYRFLFELFRRLHLSPWKAERTGGRVIAGGHGIHNPVPLSAFFDQIVLGDGETIAPDLADDADAWKDTPYVWPNATGTAWKKSEPCATLITRQYGAHVAFVELARGCRSKCFFCELGWTHRYQEAEKSDVFAALDSLPKGAHLNFLAPDATACDYYSEAIDHARNRGLLPKFNSMRLDSSAHQSALSDTCRLGVEGVSERLRKALGKPYSTEQIAQRLIAMNQSKMRGFKLFYLFDLPWTQPSDYEELETFVRRLELPQGGKIRMKFTGWLPQPGTPMQAYPKPLRLKEWALLTSRIQQGKWKTDDRMAKQGVRSTAIHFLPIQSLDHQAWETYCLRAGEEFPKVLQELEGRKITQPFLRLALKRQRVDLDEVMGGKMLGVSVLPVRPFPDLPIPSVERW